MIYAAEKILNAYQHKAGASLTPLEVADLVRKLGLVRVDATPSRKGVAIGTPMAPDGRMR